MSELDLRLEWRDEGEREVRADSFEGELLDQDGDVTVYEDEAIPEPPRPEAFEYATERALALDRALGKLMAVTRPPFVTYLRKLVDMPVPARTAALDGAEAWLSTQLTHWNPGPVMGDEAERFSEGVSAGSDALGLGLEIVALLRGGDTMLVEPLLEQVETLLTRARDCLSEAP